MMTTQAVYVLVSSPHDYFLEELWASLYSLRHFHPQARVVVMTDAPTAARIKVPTYQQLLSMITELMIVPVTEGYSGMQRSREIKTNVRNLIRGDFLYIDTDTIITDSLEDIDNLKVKNLAMVPDAHLHSFAKNRADLLPLLVIVKKVYGIELSDIPTYFNAGVTYVRDNAFTREFFTKWHNNWLIALSKGIDTDQQALAYTDKCYGYVIEQLPDIYNCQVMFGAKYLLEAKIMHIYRNWTCMVDYPTHTLWDLYPKIREEGGVSEEVKAVLMDAKNHLSASSCIINSEDMGFLRCKFYKLYKLNKFHLRWLIDKFNRWATQRENKRKIRIV